MSRLTRHCGGLGKLDGFELEPIVPAIEQWRYRNKLEYSFGTDPDRLLICGFHAPGRWEDIVGIPTACSASEAGQSRARGGAWPGAGAGPPGV